MAPGWWVTSQQTSLKKHSFFKHTKWRETQAPTGHTSFHVAPIWCTNSSPCFIQTRFHSSSLVVRAICQSDCSIAWYYNNRYSLLTIAVYLLLYLCQPSQCTDASKRCADEHSSPSSSCWQSRRVSSPPLHLTLDKNVGPLTSWSPPLWLTTDPRIEKQERNKVL